MAGRVLYPGLDSNKQQITSEEQARTNFFVVPEKYYSTPMFTQSIDSHTGEVKQPSSHENVYDQEGITWGDGSKFTMENMVNKLNRTISLNNEGNAMTSFRKEAKFYNRFKVADLNDSFQKGFPHVFFVRPNINIFNADRTALLSRVAANANFNYAFNSAPELLYQLIDKAPGTDHDWMMYLSNKVGSFSLSDEYIETGEYGKTYTGYKITYGKHSIASKTAGSFTISYTDDKYLHVYHLHKLWVEYISNLYRGVFSPRDIDVINKIRDYTSSVYYILTAEDGETVIFWSKYYGVFPTTIPSTQLTWGNGNVVQQPTFDVTYSFSFKEDFNPLSLLELNYNTGMSLKVPYVPTFDPLLGHTGDTWVGPPFIEVNDGKANNGLPYYFKLRFKNSGDTRSSNTEIRPIRSSQIVGGGYDGRIPSYKVYDNLLPTQSQSVVYTDEPIRRR